MKAAVASKRRPKRRAAVSRRRMAGRAQAVAKGKRKQTTEKRKTKETKLNLRIDILCGLSWLSGLLLLDYKSLVSLYCLFSFALK